MAITAGDNAAYSAAIPIAEQDAGVYNNAAGVNAAAANTFAVDNQNAGNAASQYNAGAANTLTGEQLSNQTALTNAQLAAQTSIATNAASNATSVANTAATAASSKAIAQLNATNTANIQGASNTQQLAAAYQNALTNNASMNMDATSKYQTDLAAFNAYKNAVSILDQSAGIPDMSSQLQFNEIDPATGAAATNPNSPANANP
jgi:vacuolar-type H+-ATPase subunit I/STV1